MVKLADGVRTLPRGFKGFQSGGTRSGYTRIASAVGCQVAGGIPDHVQLEQKPKLTLYLDFEALQAVAVAVWRNEVRWRRGILTAAEARECKENIEQRYYLWTHLVKGDRAYVRS